MNTFGLQLYSLRDVTDFDRRLEIAAQAGYTGVEFAGYGGYDAAALRQRLEALRLEPMGSHIGHDLLSQDLAGCVRFCAEVGIRSAALPHANPQTDAEVDDLADFLERCAITFGEAGIPFCYHNHAHEFERGYYERLLRRTSAAQFELDVYWAAYADVDPAALIRQYAGRFPLLHLKELSAEKTNVELGRGVLDFPAIVAAGAAQGTWGYIVEQEGYTLPVEESVAVSGAYVRQL